jgi:hypothetical protein
MFNIFEEISWSQFIQLPEVNRLSLNEQVQHYNQYLYQLSEARTSWIVYQNKGPLVEETSYLLQEDGGFLLQENGFNIIIE